MLPLHQAYEIQESLISYLKATFSFNDERLEVAFNELMRDPKKGLFKGPYLSLKLPYVKALDSEVEKCPLTIKPDWPPYDHQIKSWNRLDSSESPQPTIITTGTGSGKTESFLYPLLDHCLKNKHKKGIKAIILYPMNALATDQSKRLAEAIQDDERLHGLRAGLFIGLGHGNKKNFPNTMSPDRIIENRDEILDSPPDILLTNFKMLDYGLMRAKYQKLWKHNIEDSSTLKFLVLDELHTYDGAQGTDVANLIRRLKLKLNMSSGQLCPIGTSATIGSGIESKKDLAEYATKLFGEQVDEDCIVTENRVDILSFFGVDSQKDLRPDYPSLSALEECNNALQSSVEKYHQVIKQSWNISEDADGLDVTNFLLKNRFFYYVLSVCEQGIVSIDQLISELQKVSKDFRTIPEWEEEGLFHPRITMIESLLTLISMAKSGKDGRFPLINTQVQLWIRELTKLLRVVGDKPEFTWDDSEYKQKDVVGLPPYFCRECGGSGWLGMKPDNHNKFSKDRVRISTEFISNHKNIWLLNEKEIKAVEEYKPTEYIEQSIHKETLEFTDGSNADQDIDLIAYRRIKGTKSEQFCPECNSRNTLAIIGTRVATLSSVAISQNLSTDLDPTDDANRKVLAFTNSVQDAAHQAGFVESRNYRFTFRSSLQKIINSAEKELNLQELSNRFIDHWSSDKEAFYWRFFPSDYLGKVSPKNFKENGVYSEDFEREFEHRMRWQVYEAFGHRAMIGRTLEKSQSSAASISETKMLEIYASITPWAKDNNLRLDQDSFVKFLSIVLHRIRTRGGVSHRYLHKARKGKMIMWELNWTKDNTHFLNPKYYENSSRFPKLISTDANRKALTDSTYSKSINWFHQYFIKTFPLAPANTEIINEFYQQLFEVVSNVGVTDKVHGADSVSYAISPIAITVSKECNQYKCNKCNSKISAGTSSTNIEGARCLNYRCKNGSYYPITNEVNELGYYQQIYNRDKSPRIYASEHTGMLERRKRENIETDFKQRPKFNSLNVLVATSTLEMGIDIGTLNTAINNNIPPLPANYLQRIGRAGRSSGSALVLNFAKTQDHDLYYYDEPSKMMEGEVGTPGCFLEAKEILERHYLAFCIDQWTTEGEGNHRIPTFIRELKVRSLDINSPQFFVNQIFDFVDQHIQRLKTKFTNGYSDQLSPEIIASVIAKFEDGSARDIMKRVFEKLKDEERISNQRRLDIEKRIKDQKLGKEDPEYIELKSEISNLARLWKSKKSIMVLEHLTNVGLLPNYAFPESGVNLEALIIPAYSDGIIQQERREEISVTRGASQAIKELVPDNSFYTQGNRIPITGLNTVEWSDPLIKSKKRFCSKCDYVESDGYNADACPKCGHESFGSINNTHTFVKLTGVKSVVNKSKSRLTDSRDEREIEIYNISQHLHFSSAIAGKAFVIDGEGFGIEYVSNLKLRDVNLGHSDSVSSDKTIMNDREVPTHGFVTCKHCGFSTSKPGLYRARDERMHYGYCKHKAHKYDDTEGDVFEHIYLYREFITEALKIKIPRTDIDDNIDIRVLSSAIQLGLREFFKGSPSHLKLREYSEYNKVVNRFEQYIVLIDNIPGGSSYLKNIFNITNFNEILRLSYEKLRDCNCQHEELDGCYKCIYSYENQYIQETLSRSKAVLLIEKYISKKDNWIEVESLGSVANNGGLEESELEDRFTYWLENLNNKEIDTHLINVEIDREYDQKIWKISIENEVHSLLFSCRQQVAIGPNNGVEYRTRPDVLITCESIINKNEIDTAQNVADLPKIAIYLDGYRYHASKENLRFYDDLKKREALTISDQYIPWTLTWSDFDLDLSEDELGDSMHKALNDIRYKDTIKKMIPKQGHGFIASLLTVKNSLQRLLMLMSNYDTLETYEQSVSHCLGMMQEEVFIPSFDKQHLDTLMDLTLDISTTDRYIKDKDTLKKGIVLSQASIETEFIKNRILVNINDKEFYYNHLTCLVSHDLEQQDWHYFWQLMNLLQLKSKYHQNSKAVDIEELLSLFTGDYRKALEQLLTHGLITISEETEAQLNELTDNNGNVIADAELILPYFKIVFGPYDNKGTKAFEDNGYEIKEIENFDIKDFIKK